MNSKETARLRKLAAERGGTVQGDVTVSDSPDHVPRPGKKVKKLRKKPEPTGLAGTKVGRNVLMVDNENVKPGDK